MASLFVYMNGYEVGEYIQRSGEPEFIYSDSWLEHGAMAIPLSLSIPLTEKKHKGDNVYNYFANLLPDNKDIRERIQTRFGAKTDKPFDLLSFIGKDCVGAIQLLTEKDDVNVKKIEGTPLSNKEIAEELKNYKTIPLGMTEDDDFRISLAGAQEKTALLWHDEKWQRPIGTTPTTHIFKLPIGKIEYNNIDLSESVENEWLCNKILKEFDLPVPNVEMKTFEDVKVLIIERFDRERSNDKNWIIRKPQEDMCQANGISPGLKYETDGGPGIETIMDVLKSSLDPKEERKQFMKTIFLFWLLGAIDGHAKNFSIYLKEGGRFCLTPIYDVISAYPMSNQRQIDYQKLKMAMALHSKNTHYHLDKIIPRHWFNQSKKVGFPETSMKDIIDESISNINNVINNVSSIIPKRFPEDIYTPIFEGMMQATKKFH